MRKLRCHDGSARPKEQTAEEGHEGDFVACPGFPCWDTRCLTHYTEEGTGIRLCQGGGSQEEQVEGRQDQQEVPGAGEVIGSRQLPCSPEGAELTMDTPYFMILWLLSKL